MALTVIVARIDCRIGASGDYVRRASTSLVEGFVGTFRVLNRIIAAMSATLLSERAASAVSMANDYRRMGMTVPRTPHIDSPMGDIRGFDRWGAHVCHLRMPMLPQYSK
jgi:hypothetical protein